MNGIVDGATANGGGGSYDTCGYDQDVMMSVDTRNTKFQASKNHIDTAASNKSFNYKNYMKYMKRKDAKLDRIAKKEADL
jgi:hypothetical protein